ncbi:MAG: hypothetical protein B6I31_04320 [Desulfobacteraceae bacterium 4572_19]|nr:MAG: hypothetical protein B6I31_04320 [Desulfobacteraceae bacterium 4572_19]
MNVEYINPFINATLNVITTMAGINPVLGRPHAKRSTSVQGDISGIIGLDGHGIKGVCVVSFEIPCICYILSKILGEKIVPGQDMNDGVGEITNMISGGAKAELSQKGFFFDVAVPTVVEGNNYSIGHMTASPIIVLPFKIDAGEFYIEASVSKIEEDFAKDVQPEVKPAAGMLTVTEFAKKAGMAPVKVKSFLKNNFITGKKVSDKQWHIPVAELSKFSGKGRGAKSTAVKQQILVTKEMLNDAFSLKEFAAKTSMKQTKVKSFIKSGFLSGFQDSSGNWFIKKNEVEKIRNRSRSNR